MIGLQREKEKIRLMEKSTLSGLTVRPSESTTSQPAKAANANKDSGYGKDVKGKLLQMSKYSLNILFYILIIFISIFKFVLLIILQQTFKHN